MNHNIFITCAIADVSIQATPSIGDNKNYILSDGDTTVHVLKCMHR